MNARPEVVPRDGELGRLAKIAHVAASKGFGRYAERLGFRTRGEGEAPSAAESDARRFREALEELGPTFVKLGQMIAGRTDLFPEALTEELRKLHEAASPFPVDVARRTIEDETGREVDALFATFDDAPLAAASIAQVHRATLYDGTAVVVKVQRPGIEAMVDADIAILRHAARLLDTAMPWLRAFNLPQLIEEFAETIRGELDFEREARNVERFAEANRDEPDVYVPHVFPQVSTRRILTMVYSPGLRLDVREGDPVHRAALAQTLMRLFLVHVFEQGVFHADPHPGNVFALPDGRLCFHDFGALGELAPRVQENLRELFLAVMARDPSWLASAYLGMGGATRELDRTAFTRDLSAALDRYYRESSAGRQSFSAIMHAFVRLGREHNIRLLRETALLVRAFAELEGLVRGLDPAFSSLEAFRAYSPRLLKHAFLLHPDVSSVAELYRLASALRDVGRETPLALRRLLGRLERDEPLFDIRHQSGGSLERHLLHASNRLAFALIIAAIVVGSAIIVGSHAGPHLEGVPLLGIIGFVIAGALGIAWAVIALKSGKL